MAWDWFIQRTKNIHQKMHKAVAVRLAKKACPGSDVHGTSSYSCFSTVLRYKVDCGYYTYIVDELNGNNIVCRSFDGSNWINEVDISLDVLYQYNLLTTYFFEPNYFYKPKETKGLARIYILYFTRYPYFFNKIYEIFCNKLSFLHFNKEASANERIQLLKFLVREQVNNGKQEIEYSYILQKYFLAHPLGSTDRKLQKQKMEIYLDSLQGTGDIQKIETKIKICGNAINTIDQFDSQKSQQRISCLFQLLMTLATIAIAWFAYEQIK